MRKQTIALGIVLLLLFIGTLSIGTENDNLDYQNYNLDFNFNGKDYNFNVKQLAEEKGISLEQYPYYFVGIENDSKEVAICYNTSRISINYKSGDIYKNVGQK